MVAAVACALSQLQHGARRQMRAVENPQRRRIRNAVIALSAVALAFYFGFIALAVLRSRH